MSNVSATTPTALHVSTQSSEERLANKGLPTSRDLSMLGLESPWLLSVINSQTGLTLNALLDQLPTIASIVRKMGSSKNLEAQLMMTHRNTVIVERLNLLLKVIFGTSSLHYWYGITPHLPQLVKHTLGIKFPTMQEIWHVLRLTQTFGFLDHLVPVSPTLREHLGALDCLSRVSARYTGEDMPCNLLSFTMTLIETPRRISRLSRIVTPFEPLLNMEIRFQSDPVAYLSPAIISLQNSTLMVIMLPPYQDVLLCVEWSDGRLNVSSILSTQL